MEIDQIIKRTGIHCIVVNQQNQLLVLKRSETDEKDPNFWDLPGGGIETDENITDAAMREVQEEAGLSVNKINLIGSYTCDEGRLQLCALCEMTGGNLQLSHEHSEYRWLTAEEFVNLKPAGLHLVAGQFFIKSSEKVKTYNQLYEV